VLEEVEGPFDDVAASVGPGVVGDGSPALGTAVFAVTDLVRRLGDDRDVPLERSSARLPREE
jgi:hypothetical protein